MTPNIIRMTDITVAAAVYSQFMFGSSFTDFNTTFEAVSRNLFWGHFSPSVLLFSAPSLSAAAKCPPLNPGRVWGELKAPQQGMGQKGSRQTLHDEPLLQKKP